MLPIQTVLLFGAPPLLDLQTTGENLIALLQSAGHDAEEINPASGELLRFRVGSLSISVSMTGAPVAGETLTGSTQSPLCRRALDDLFNSIDNHRHHMTITLANLAPTAAEGPHANPLQQLRLAHLAATFFAQTTKPQTVHWRQSNILMTAEQYRGLGEQITPWALFARLRAIGAPPTETGPNNSGVLIENAGDFIGAPVQLEPSELPLDTACAAALAFLRHAVQADTPLGDGQTFGPEPDMLFRLEIIKPCPQHAAGLYQLWEASGRPNTVSGVPARTPGTTLIQVIEKSVRSEEGSLVLPQLNPEQSGPPEETEKTRSLALSYLMLVIMPPLGAVLLVSNVIFGVNAWRTGLVALVTVAIGIVIGAYAFLNVETQDSAILTEPSTIQTDQLSN